MIVHREALLRLLQHFGPPRHVTDVAAWLADYGEVLRGYGTDVVSAAATRLIAEHTGGYPQAAVIRRLCAEIVEAREACRPRPVRRDPWDEAQALADRLIASPLGVRARDEGWLSALHEYARQHGRLPDGADIPALRHRRLPPLDTSTPIGRAAQAALDARLRRLEGIVADFSRDVPVDGQGNALRKASTAETEQGAMVVAGDEEWGW